MDSGSSWLGTYPSPFIFQHFKNVRSEKTYDKMYVKWHISDMKMTFRVMFWCRVNFDIGSVRFDGEKHDSLEMRAEQLRIVSSESICLP